MLVSLGLVVLGLLLLVGGGELLLRGAVGAATLLRLPPAVIGLTIVAVGTSVPELAVSLAAGVQGKPDITVGNVVGSNIFNATVIIGLCALIRPVPLEGNILRLEYPVLVLVTLAALAVCEHGVVNRLDGVFFLAAYAAFTAYLVRLVREKVTPAELHSLRREATELAEVVDRPPRWWVVGLLIVLGVALLAVGVEVTLRGAVDLGARLGLSERVIGLTIVAAGTGAPEVVVSVVSALRGRSDVAVGNVIGSNLFNVLGILGLSALVSPLPVHPGIAGFDNWWHLGVTLLLFPVMRNGLRVYRWEGALLLATYATYLTLLLTRG
jgi:cation:H+ antiporter